MRIVTLMSGGLDSAVLVAQQLADGHAVVPFAVDYGQRHRVELHAAQKVRDEYARRWPNAVGPLMLADLTSITRLFNTSSQTNDSIPVPEGHYQAESMKVTVVPNRNMMMLSVAIAHAVSAKADAVALAVHGGDHAIYPDCRPSFIQRMSMAALLCDWHPVVLLAPFLGRTKVGIVQLGQELNVPFATTWSCYNGRALQCGRCGTCTERREAFQLAGINDPTSYEE